MAFRVVFAIAVNITLGKQHFVVNSLRQAVKKYLAAPTAYLCKYLTTSLQPPSPASVL